MNPAFVTSIACVVACLALAGFGITRSRRDLADWSFSVGFVLLAAERLCGGMSLNATTLGAVERWQEARLVLMSLFLGSLLLLSLTYARGNSGAFVFRWRYVLGGALIVPTGLVLLFRDALFRLAYAESGPGWLLRLSIIGIVVTVLHLTIWILVLMNLERTFRAAIGTMRWRIKFMMLALALLCVVGIYVNSQALLFRGFDQRHETIMSVAALIAALLSARSVWRTGRFRADVYPSQSVLEGSLTVLLAGLYLCGVGVLAKVVATFGGDTGFALKAFILLISVVLLAVFLQSDRVRLRVRQVVSRNFQRPIYDYRGIWLRFTDETASCVDQNELCRAVVKLSADVFQALAVTIWTVNERKDSVSVAASTSLSDSRTHEWTPDPAEAALVLRYFETHPHPVDIETAEFDWAEVLRRWHPSGFPNGGHRICAPLVRQREIVGIIMVGDRVSGIAFPDQDMDLLKCIADQVTARLLNLQLAQRILQARESEAFQTMATFFVHDLKNAASTLNLMLQNLPVHFGDPEFRADALRGLGKTAAHINGLISRLGQLRGRLELKPAPANLNDIVRSTLSGFPHPADLKLEVTLAELPTLPLDTEQIQKVVLNLVLNASEACEGRGRVTLHTTRRDTGVVLTVTDTGCGMTPEFIKNGLFRPFKTTKKSGLGIGMFQSKMIVDAHGGTMSVASSPGQGTTFDIYLPTRGNHS